MAEISLARRPGRTRSEERNLPGRRVVPGLVLVLAVLTPLVLLAAGGRPDAPAGLPDAGAVTGWLLPLARAAMDLGAVGTIGTLLVAAFLVPTADNRLGATGRRALASAAHWAAGWSASAAAVAVLSTSDAVGVPVGEVLRSPALLRFGLQLPDARALVVMSLVALALALNVRTVRTRLGSVLVLLLAAGALVPLLLAGHSAVATDHYVATQGLLLHVLGATVWVGGLVALLHLLRQDRSVLALAVPRFSRLALVCFVVVALSGVLTAWTRLGLQVDNWLTTYGTLVLVKSGALLLLGVAGLLHRRHAVPRVVAGVPRSFLRLAGVEVLVMGAAVAVAVVLGRTAPPVGGGLEVGNQHGGRFPTVDREIDPFGLPQLVTQWRLDAVVVTGVALLAVGYLLAVRTLRRRGQVWPAAQVAWTLGGLAVLLYALCGGVGSYSAAMLSMQVTQLLTMLTLVPAMLTLGAPVRLVRTVAGVDEGAGGRVGRFIADPVNAMLVVTGLLVGLYATPLLDASLRSPALHLSVNVLALVVGLVVFGSVLARDWLPVVRSARDRAAVVLAPAVLLLLLGVVTWRADTGYGSSYFEDLNLWWADPAADPRRAALIAVVFAIPLLGLSLGLARKPMPRAGTPQSP